MYTSARLLFLFVIAGILVCSAPTPSHAQVEVEADPIAYILSGYSGHLAYVATPVRGSLGVFAADVPEFFHGNEGWTNTTRGATVKLDYLGPNPGGFFVGLDGGWQRAEYSLDATGTSEEQDIYGIGVRTGYRVLFENIGFYLVPWASVSYLLNADDIVLDGETFEQGRIQVFPTVHVGWRF